MNSNFSSKCECRSNTLIRIFKVQTQFWFITFRSYWSEFSSKNPIGQNKNGSGSYVFSDANYNLGYSGHGHNLLYDLKSDIPQGNTVYDAARANVGSPWMMPTKDQLQELIDNTTSVWTNIDGRNGRKFTSKNDSSKYIFLPPAGNWYDTTLDYVGKYGRYWSTVRYDLLKAWNLIFYLDRSLQLYHDNDGHLGMSIRPVAPPKPW